MRSNRLAYAALPILKSLRAESGVASLLLSVNVGQKGGLLFRHLQIVSISVTTLLRNEIKSDSVDLVYLDPPFNSKANYNLLFKSPNGHESHAQITAFEDTWHWGEQTENEFGELTHHSNTDVSEMMQALRCFLGENDMMAYLVMMANRLLELHRVLRDTGSLYLHCDPTASHYLKIVLDGVFGVQNFRNEIVWQRFGSHNDPRQFGQFGRVTDSILFYSKTNDYVFNPVKGEYSQDHLTKRFRYEDSDGRKFWPNTMLAPGGRGPDISGTDTLDTGGLPRKTCRGWRGREKSITAPKACLIGRTIWILYRDKISKTCGRILR